MEESAAMTSFYDETHRDQSIEHRRRDARAKYESAKARLEKRRALLLESFEDEKYTVDGPAYHKDVWGHITRLPPIEILASRDAERKFNYQQYLLDYEWYLRCLLEYERFKDLPESHRRPGFSPRRAPEDQPRGPLGVQQPSGSPEATTNPKVREQEETLRELEQSIVEAERERSLRSVRRLLVDMETTLREGLEILAELASDTQPVGNSIL